MSPGSSSNEKQAFCNVSLERLLFNLGPSPGSPSTGCPTSRSEFLNLWAVTLRAFLPNSGEVARWMMPVWSPSPKTRYSVKEYHLHSSSKCRLLFFRCFTCFNPHHPLMAAHVGQVTVAGSPALLVDEQRLAHATRISCAPCKVDKGGSSQWTGRMWTCRKTLGQQPFRE